MNNDSNKKMCGLWHEHVAPSEHNSTCNCVNCFGTHCQVCPTYQELVAEIMDSIHPLHCHACRGMRIR
ncbi:hypothetical protein HDR66_02880 [bacterium]|nr:hypothetical protein [bacterium]